MRGRAFALGFVVGLLLGGYSMAFYLTGRATWWARDPGPGQWRSIAGVIATASTTTYMREVETHAVLMVRCTDGELAPQVLDAPEVKVSLEGGLFEFENGAVRGRFVLDQDLLREFREDCHS